jgi:hypothetical protein
VSSQRETDCANVRPDIENNRIGRQLAKPPLTHVLLEAAKHKQRQLDSFSQIHVESDPSAPDDTLVFKASKLQDAVETLRHAQLISGRQSCQFNPVPQRPKEAYGAFIIVIKGHSGAISEGAIATRKC